MSSLRSGVAVLRGDEPLSFSRRGFVWATGLLLPLGPYGIAGIVVAAIFLVTHARVVLGVNRWILLAPLPVVTVTLVSTLRGSSDLYVLAGALGLALLYTPGLAVLAALLRGVPPLTGTSAVVSGTALLGSTVLVDAVVTHDAIPAGLFPSHLHNWSAALLVLAFPLSLQILFSKRWWMGIFTLPLIVSGVFFSLSWSGVVGLLAAGLCYGVLRLPRTALVLALLGTGWWVAKGSLPPRTMPTSVASSYDAIAGRLGPIVFDRIRIAAEGLELAAMKPWLGWGFGNMRSALSESPLGAFYVDDLALAHFHNLFIQTLFETGVVGFVAFGLLLGFLFLYQHGPYAPAVRAALVGFFVTQLFDVAWVQSNIQASVWYVVALSLLPMKETPSFR